MTTTTQSGVDTTNTNSAMTTDQAAEMLLNRWQDAPQAPSKGQSEGEEDAAVSPEDAADVSDEEELLEEETEGTEEDQQETEAEHKYLDSDDVMVKVVVDGEEHVASVKDLKRLYGQEASLTRKSQETAARRKQAEEIGNHYVTGLQRMIQVAEEEYKPYANIDFLVASKELSAEELQALRTEATAKYEKYRYFTSELANHTRQMEEQRVQLMAEQAQQTIKELTDPKTGIPGWNQQLYNEVRQHAIENGMHPDIVNSIVDAPSLRILHGAYKYAKAKRVATTKKATGAKNVIKSSGSSDTGRFKSQGTALSNLKKTGSRDDAVAALLERWSKG